jgi:hypothetical protein
MTKVSDNPRARRAAAQEENPRARRAATQEDHPRARRRQYNEDASPAQSGLDLLLKICRAYASAGITNAIALEIDQKQIFLDTEEREDDLNEMMSAAQRSGELQKPFHNMHILLSHEEEGLRTLFDIRADQEALAGAAPITTDISARILQMQIRRGEGAKDYAERLRSFAADTSLLDEYRRSLTDLTERVAAHLGHALPDASVTHEAVTVRMQKLTPQQIGNFRNLSFGETVETPRMRMQSQQASPRSHRFTRYAAPPPPEYRGVRDPQLPRPSRRTPQEAPPPTSHHRAVAPSPASRRAATLSPAERRAATTSASPRRLGRGAPAAPPARNRRGGRGRRHASPPPRQRRPLYVDTYNIYYYDPYYDFALYVLFTGMLYSHCWHLPYVYILDPWGYALGSAFYAEDFLIHDPWFHDGFVDVGYDGVMLDASIPYVDAYDHGYLGEYDGFGDSFYDAIDAGDYDLGDSGYDAAYDDGGYDDYGDGDYDDYGDGDYDDYDYDDGGYDDYDYDDGGYDDYGDSWDDGGGWDNNGGW